MNNYIGDYITTASSNIPTITKLLVLYPGSAKPTAQSQYTSACPLCRLNPLPMLSLDYFVTLVFFISLFALLMFPLLAAVVRVCLWRA